MILIPLFLAAALALTACAAPAPSASLSGTSWKLVSYGPASAQTPAAAGVDTKLTFGADGNLSGNLGCNSLGGPYTVKGDQITFGALVSTLMACPDPQMTQEAAAFQVLKDTVAFKLSASTLTITAPGNAGTLTFTAITPGQ